MILRKNDEFYALAIDKTVGIYKMDKILVNSRSFNQTIINIFFRRDTLVVFFTDRYIEIDPLNSRSTDQTTKKRIDDIVYIDRGRFAFRSKDTVLISSEKTLTKLSISCDRLLYLRENTIFYEYNGLVFMGVIHNHKIVKKFSFPGNCFDQKRKSMCILKLYIVTSERDIFVLQVHFNKKEVEILVKEKYSNFDNNIIYDKNDKYYLFNHQNVTYMYKVISLDGDLIISSELFMKFDFKFLDFMKIDSKIIVFDDNNHCEIVNLSTKTSQSYKFSSYLENSTVKVPKKMQLKSYAFDSTFIYFKTLDHFTAEIYKYNKTTEKVDLKSELLVQDTSLIPILVFNHPETGEVYFYARKYFYDEFDDETSIKSTSESLFYYTVKKVVKGRYDFDRFNEIYTKDLIHNNYTLSKSEKTVILNLKNRNYMFCSEFCVEEPKKIMNNYLQIFKNRSFVSIKSPTKPTTLLCFDEDSMCLKYFDIFNISKEVIVSAENKIFHGFIEKETFSYPSDIAIGKELTIECEYMSGYEDYNI